MTDNALVPSGVGVSKYAGALSSVLKKSAYLPYIVVGGSSAKLVKERKLPMGSFGLISGKNVTDLTDEFNCILISVRPKAMRFAPDMMSVYDPESPEFHKIEELAPVNGSNCAAGVEFLVWLPEYSVFACFFFSSVSAQNEAPNVMTYLNRQNESGQWNPCKFVCELLGPNRKQQTWHSMVAHDCQEEITNLPPGDELLSVSEKFNNPPVSSVETADAPASEGRE